MNHDTSAKHRKALPKRISLYQLLPNIITVLSLCLGITSVRYALDEKFHISAMLIIIACFTDWLDGYVARHFNFASEFGAQLDSLADLTSFGIAPSIVVYLWSLYNVEIKGIGWAVVLIYATCAALRLARFNTQGKNRHFFTGVPMPAAAALCITPMIVSFKLLEGHHFPTLVIALYITIVGILMVSKIPTFTLKNVKIKRQYAPVLLVLSTILVVSLLLEPWIVVPSLSFLYLCSIAFSCAVYARQKQTAAICSPLISKHH